MAVYWLSFRLEENLTYERRYEALTNTIQTNSRKYWKETTSFYAFESIYNISMLAREFRSCIDTSRDLFLIRRMNVKSAIICGHNTDLDIYKLIPYLKRI